MFGSERNLWNLNLCVEGEGLGGELGFTAAGHSRYLSSLDSIGVHVFQAWGTREGRIAFPPRRFGHVIGCYMIRRDESELGRRDEVGERGVYSRGIGKEKT